MNRRNALRALGSATICGFAGCSNEEDSESVSPPPLTGVILWSILEADETASARITVEKDGSQIFETVHEFEGESRFHLAKDWMGDEASYSVTVESIASGETDTHTSPSNPSPNDCWLAYGDVYSSSVLLTRWIDEEHC